MVAMGKTLCGWPAMAGLAIALMAGCFKGPEEPQEWHGLARHSCGPTDGTATSIQVDSLPAVGCEEAQEGFPSYGTYAFNLDQVPMDSIRVGATYLDSMQICQLECGPKTFYTLSVESVTTERIQGTLTVHSNIGSPRKLVREVRVKLKKCPKRTVVCG